MSLDYVGWVELNHTTPPPQAAVVCLTLEIPPPPSFRPSLSWPVKLTADHILPVRQILMTANKFQIVFIGNWYHFTRRILMGSCVREWPQIQFYDYLFGTVKDLLWLLCRERRQYYPVCQLWKDFARLSGIAKCLFSISVLLSNIPWLSGCGDLFIFLSVLLIRLFLLICKVTRSSHGPLHYWRNINMTGWQAEVGFTFI